MTIPRRDWVRLNRAGERPGDRLAVLAGLCRPLCYGAPSGPSIVVAAMLLSMLGLVPGGQIVRRMRTSRRGERL
jgi:hypothetical protein